MGDRNGKETGVDMNNNNDFNYKQYLASREWALLKRQVQERCGGYCERCGYGNYEETHHITYERLGHESLDDLLAVCHECHQFLSAKSDYDPASDVIALVIVGRKSRAFGRSLFTALEQEQFRPVNVVRVSEIKVRREMLLPSPLPVWVKPSQLQDSSDEESSDSLPIKQILEGKNEPPYDPRCDDYIWTNKDTGEQTFYVQRVKVSFDSIKERLVLKDDGTYTWKR